jgi:predicted O-methyltransferase YrrM
MNTTTEQAEAYIDALYRPLRGALGALRIRAENEHIPIIQKSTEMFLRGMINIKRPMRILEIGTAVGYSAAFVAEKEKDASVISIDSDEEMYKKAMQNLKDLNLSERVTVFHGDAETVIREYLSDYKFDFVFIDAAKSHYKRFFNAAVEICTNDAIIISDNVLLKGVAHPSSVHRRFRTNVRNMKEYIEYILSLGYAETSILPIGGGIAVTVLRKSV